MSISVVIPAYNAAPFLAETLESVLSQSHPASEVLVIDDGSKDETAEVANQFSQRVTVIRQANAGLPATRNVGVQNSKGEWIAFVDADDLWRRDKLELQMKALASMPTADVCYSTHVDFEETGTTKRFRKPWPAPDASEIKDALYQHTSFLPSTAVIRKSMFLAVGGSDPLLKIGEDWDLWLRMLHSGAQFVNCPEPLVFRRLHGNNMSGDAIGSLEAAKALYRRHVLPRLPPGTRWISFAKMQSAHESAAAMALRENKDGRCRTMMARSLLRFPFNDPYRYKMLIRMILGPLKS